MPDIDYYRNQIATELRQGAKANHPKQGVFNLIALFCRTHPDNHPILAEAMASLVADNCQLARNKLGPDEAAQIVKATDEIIEAAAAIYLSNFDQVVLLLQGVDLLYNDPAIRQATNRYLAKRDMDHRLGGLE